LRLTEKEKIVVFTPDRNTSVFRIFETIKTVIQQIPKKEFVPKAVVQKVISLEETILNLTRRITENMRMSFKDFSGMGRVEKVNVIVSFLAMLELVKQGIIQVRQDADFHDIEIENQTLGIPRY
jgi:chromatin segregation and condensation protein Rec8/ScpA/Scc1 (kleisin family)